MTAAAGSEAAFLRGGAGAALDDDGFQTHFREHITPHLDALERKRLVLKDKYAWRLAIAAAGTLCAVLVATAVYLLLPDGAVSDMEDAEALFVVPLLFGFGLLLWAQAPRRRFVRGYKETLLPAVAGYFGEFSYDAEGGIAMSRLNDSTLIPSHDTYRHEDLFTGCYREVDVEFCEARLTERRGSGKNRRTVTVFAGVFVLLTMNKNFKGKTVVRRDAGKLGNWLKGTFSKLEPVRLEDPEFERQFEVYSDDQVEARYLLTPAFMTRMMNLGKALGTDKLEAAFFGARLMIKLPAQWTERSLSLSLREFNLVRPGKPDLFEPGSIFTSVHNISRLNRIVEEFRTILSIVDVLKLHEQTRL